MLKVILILTCALGVYLKSIPPEIPTTASKYPLRRPLRHSYLRMNSKANFNPLIGHLVNS